MSYVRMSDLAQVVGISSHAGVTMKSQLDQLLNDAKTRFASSQFMAASTASSSSSWWGDAVIKTVSGIAAGVVGGPAATPFGGTAFNLAIGTAGQEVVGDLLDRWLSIYQQGMRAHDSRQIPDDEYEWLKGHANAVKSYVSALGKQSWQDTAPFRKAIEDGGGCASLLKITTPLSGADLKARDRCLEPCAMAERIPEVGPALGWLCRNWKAAAVVTGVGIAGLYVAPFAIRRYRAIRQAATE